MNSEEQKSMSKIKFAVIGQGHIGKRHAEMVRRNPETELIAVCDVAAKDKVFNETVVFAQVVVVLQVPSALAK